MEAVAIVPPQAPLLETIAQAILGGTAAEGGTPLPPIVLGGSVARLATARSPRVVFLGWQAGWEETRKRAAKTLAALASAVSGPDLVALFELSRRESAPGSPRATTVDIPGDPLDTTRFGPAERFVLDSLPDGEFVSLRELARARRWGAQTYSRWRSVHPSASEDQPPESTSKAPAWASWCGATE